MNKGGSGKPGLFAFYNYLFIYTHNKKHSMRKLLLLSSFLLLVAFAQARIIYVSSITGNDTRTITQAQNSSTPWASLSKVQSSLSSITSRDSILFQRGGRYSGTLNMYGKTNIYFGTYGAGPKPIFWGTGAVLNSLVTLTTCTNIRFDGWNVSDTTISFTDRTVQAKIKIVFTLQTTTTGTVIKNITMDRIGYGIYITSTSRGQLIDSCDIGNLRMIKNTPKTINPDDDYGGVPIQISSRNNTVTNNYFHDCYSVSYDYGFDGGGIEFFEEGDTISGNRIMYNTFYDNNGTLEHGSNSDGVARFPIQNNTFAYNKVINCSSIIYYNNNGQYKTKLRNLMVYNNVIVQTVASRTGSTRMISMAIADTTYNIATLKNNIFRISTGAAVARSTVFAGTQLIHTNNVYQLTNGSVTNYPLTPTEISTLAVIWVNTMSTNPINWDYRLTPASPAISRGTNVGIQRDFANVVVSNPPEAGIYEYIPTISKTAGSTIVETLVYNSTQNSLYVNSNIRGYVRIANVLGNITMTCSYKDGGDWVNVGLLPKGLYFASSHNKSIGFIK